MATINRRKLADGTTSYRVLWRLGGTRTGAQQSITARDSPTAKRIKLEAEAHRHRITNSALLDLLFGQVVDDVPTVAEWLTRHIDGLRGVLTAGTIGEYDRTVRLHVTGSDLGATRLDKVNRDTVQRWVSNMAAGVNGARKQAPKSIANHHGLLSAALASAAQQGILESNPCPLVTLPRADDHIDEHDDVAFLSRQDVDVIVGEMCELFRPLVVLLARTGLRWGEATALTVGDVDLMSSPPVVKVTKAWKRETAAGRVLGPPKTRRSRRTVSLDSATVDALLPLTFREPGEWLFVTFDGRSPVPRATFRKRWLGVIAKATKEGRLAKKPRVHDLRHTHASWLIAAGVPLPAIQRRLGHESITTTIDRYGHLLREVDVAVLAALDGPVRAVEVADVAV